MWDPASAVCKKACWRMGSRVDCGAEPGMCSFSDASSSCKLRCRYRHRNATACAADSVDCQWDSAAAVCKPACGQVFSTAGCVSNDECTWYAGKCVIKCSLMTVGQCQSSMGKGRCAPTATH